MKLDSAPFNPTKEKEVQVIEQPVDTDLKQVLYQTLF